MNYEDEYIQIRNIQHFVYCKRRFGLLNLEKQWDENYKIVEGNIVHGKVNDPFFNESRVDQYISRSVWLYSSRYKIYGIADYMEFTKSDKGVAVDGKDGKYLINIVEYKNGKPLAGDNKTINHSDKIQLQAQIMCAEEMFGTKVSGQVYYNGINKRIKYIPNDEMIEEIKNILSSMETVIKSGITPPKDPKQNCNLCSLYDICLPKAYKNINKKSTYKNISEWEG